MVAWQPLIDAEFKIAKSEGREEPVAAYAFDALMKLAALAPEPNGVEPAVTEPTVPNRPRNRSRGRSRLRPGTSR